jgi:predicted transcriptional regulator
VARIEAGGTDPSWTTLSRLLEALGFELNVDLSVTPALDPNALDDVERILAMTPEDRLREVGNVSRFISAVRRV